jgi:NAD(P)-dependent dehydrogenase (short-subunit alcohol dehydrogenase family)
MPNYPEFSHKSVLVTGGGSGIGRATAIQFAANGARVVIGDMDRNGAEATRASIAARGGFAIVRVGDVSQDDFAASLVATAVAEFGRLDCAFNNAGIAPETAQLHDCPPEIAERVLAINLRAVWSALRCQVPVMRAQGGGAIVNTASVMGLIGRPASALYIAAKHGVVGITKAAAIENAALGVRVNAVCPGMVETGLMKEAKERADQDPEYRNMLQSLQPIGRWAQPDELAHAVLWLCSDGASFMTGHPLVVDGGYSIQ